MASIKPSFVRVAHGGIIKDANFVSLKNVGNANATLLNSFLQPGEKAVFSVDTGVLDDIDYDSTGTLLEIIALGGQPLIKNQRPVITITSPPNNASYTLGQPVTLTATANDSDGTVIGFTFKINGAVIGVLNSPPYTMSWAAQNPGIYHISAIAKDDRNDTTECPNVVVSVIKAI